MQNQNVNTSHKEMIRIHGNVEFFPAENRLRNIDTEQDIFLYTPATRCLESLIQSSGYVVEYADLIRVGWPEGEANVSLNTLYQMVSHLRKQLAIVLPGQEIIITIKRRGLKIPAEFIDENESLLLPDTLIKSASGNDVLYLNMRNIPRQKKNIGIWLWSSLIILALFANGACYRYYLESRVQVLPLFKNNFVFYKELANNCKIYINGDEYHELDSHSRININTFDCHGYTHVFISTWKMRVRSSVVFCKYDRNTGERSMRCKTYYYASNS
ncbi:TPA: winged helix-turn-helix domain-containing protein [Pluralibacter gergoviae]